MTMIYYTVLLVTPSGSEAGIGAIEAMSDDDALLRLPILVRDSIESKDTPPLAHTEEIIMRRYGTLLIGKTPAGQAAQGIFNPVPPADEKPAQKA